MIQSIRRETIALGLLNTLESERYVRIPLLAELIDALAQDERFVPALESAQALLARLERREIDDATFVCELDDLRLMVANPPASGVRANLTELKPNVNAA